MKKLVYTGFMLILAGICYIYQNEIRHFIYDVKNYITHRNVSVTTNEYFREYDFNYVQNTKQLKPAKKQDLINIFYTIINSGMDSFEFYCPSQYSTCIEDVKEIANDQNVLSHINNFVHPFNGFNHIETEYTTSGEVSVKIDKTYSYGDIAMINVEIDKLINKLVATTSNDREKIKIIHDYIINNTKYDSDRSDFNIINYKSDIAYGPLFEGFGICGGYSDTMALFLERFDIKNYKVSSDKHVWNAVYLDGGWYHLDLTWDDPVAQNNVNFLTDDFFLISSNELKNKDVTEHQFDVNVYSELKEA